MSLLGVRFTPTACMHANPALPHMPRRFTAAGDRLAACDSPAGRLGLSVCYDLRFPELYQRLAWDMGAQVGRLLGQLCSCALSSCAACVDGQAWSRFVGRGFWSEKAAVCRLLSSAARHLLNMLGVFHCSTGAAGAVCIHGGDR